MTTAPASTDTATVHPIIRPDTAARSSVRATAIARAAKPGYTRWLDHTASAGGCVRPIRLTGTLHTINPATGEVVNSRSTTEMPDGVIYIPCGDRRATVCPACAETYRADTYQMIKAGLLGGKGTPETVAQHPAVFTTVTAPSFGPVHTRTVKTHTASCPGGTDCACRPQPCRPRRNDPTCPHGRPFSCMTRHAAGDPRLGQPLCSDCYDYAGHAVWNAYASELWRRTTIKLRRLASDFGKHFGVKLDVSFGKVAEYQQRGIVHFHAIIRLDQRDDRDPTLVLPPPANITVAHLDELIAWAVAETAFATPAHPGKGDIPPHPAGWRMTWGEQLRNRPLARVGGSDITEQQVAGYVAKYATKSTETAGHLSRRITTGTIDRYADHQSHTGILIAHCWDLGANPHDNGKVDGAGNPHPAELNRPITPERAEWKTTYGRLRRWAHMLGFGGHFATRSRRYGPTRKHLKHIRRIYRRSQQLIRRDGHRTAEHIDLEPEETTLIVGELAYAGIGWLTPGDAQLALTAAARAREHRQAQKLERQTA